MSPIDLPPERQVGHLTLHRQGRPINLKEFNFLSGKERLEIIRHARGRQKYELILAAKDGARLVPHLHPQELYLTINAIGAESSIELLALADAEQMTTLLDLDCWEGDTLSPVLSLHWLGLMLETGPENLIRLMERIEPELLALFLKKHLKITRGLEAFDDDDAENARRLEALYDVEYSSEDAAKILGGLLQLMAQQCQETYLLIMEMIRSETLAVLEEEVYQSRNLRLGDLGLVPSQEARSIYGYLNPTHFQPGDKHDFTLESEHQRHPGALLAQAEPGNLLAEVLLNNSSLSTASELAMLANRKMSADLVDLGNPEEVSRSLQTLYDAINLALEYLSNKDLDQAEEIFRSSYLLQLFQVGHSLLSQRQNQARQLLSGPIGPFLDYPYQLFLDALLEDPAVLYREAQEDQPSSLEAIANLQVLERVDLQLAELSNLQRLFTEVLPFPLPQSTGEEEELPALSALLLTAVANQVLDRPFAPLPLSPADLLPLRLKTFRESSLTDEFRDQLYSLCQNGGQQCRNFISFCLENWQEDLLAVDPESQTSGEPLSLILAS